MGKTILEMKDITKLFPGVKALSDVNIQVMDDEIHALVGENGAGKSTLMNVLSGVYPYGTYTGDVIYNGNECRFKGIKDSEKVGIAIIHQELALVPYLSIGENIFLGNERKKFGTIDWDETHHKTDALLKSVGLKESSQTLIKNIGVGKQQLVEIAKALSKDVRLLILDEPTAALNEEESQHLLDLLLRLKSEGVTSIIISHKIREVEYVADRITIIRDGQTIETLTKGVDNVTEDRIISGMVGREMVDRFPKRVPKIGEVTFEVKDWNVFHPIYDEKQVIKDVSFNIRKGEVVGIAGLMGAGRTELALSLFGKAYGAKIKGKIFIDGKEKDIGNVRAAIDNGMAYVTEDRKSAGLVLMESIAKNITLAKLDKTSKHGILDKEKELKDAEQYRGELNIKTPSVLQLVRNLSGGNQQKVLLSKWIYAEPEVMILDEPTRGIDVGAKYEIYTIINRLAAEGKSVLMISSELPEILGMCDRVYVMYEGSMVAELSSEEASQETIMKHILQASRRAQ